MNKNIITRRFYSLILQILFVLVIIFPSYSDIVYPEYQGNTVIDLAHKFDEHYISSLETDLKQYDVEIRVVFINTEGKINLGFYAPKLFDKWQMSEESILVVIDPYLNKTGYGIGKKIRDEIRKRNSENKDKDKKKTEPGKNIDYDNLAAAIMDKFSLAEEKQKLPEQKNAIKNETGGNLNFSSNKSPDEDKPAPNLPPNPYILKIILALIGFILLCGSSVFIFNRKQILKRQNELKTNYTFDADIQLQELNTILEKIYADIEKMSKYNGDTKKELILHIEKLNEIKEHGDKFTEKLTNSLEEIEIDNLVQISDLIDEGSMLLQQLEQIHKESVALRKDFKATVDKSAMNISDIRVNIENCKNTIEELKTLYQLNLTHSEEKIESCEKLLLNSQNVLHHNDPIEFRNIMLDIHETIKELKRDFDVIPHLYRQLQESIPETIDAYLEESLLDPAKKSGIKDEISLLRKKALNSLLNGNLEISETTVNLIFEKLNQIKDLSKII